MNSLLRGQPADPYNEVSLRAESVPCWRVKCVDIDAVVHRVASECVVGEMLADCLRNLLRIPHNLVCIRQPRLSQIAIELHKPITVHVQDNPGLRVYAPHQRYELRKILNMHYVAGLGPESARSTHGVKPVVKIRGDLPSIRISQPPCSPSHLEQPMVGRQRYLNELHSFRSLGD